MKGFKKAIALLLVFCLFAQPLAAFAATAAPNPGTTSNVPFEKGTAGSNSFRIPSLVTLSDGTLVAAADARWNTTYDGGGLDTIVSTSQDNGANWSYTFANYLGDNGNVYNGSDSTCFIDPAMAVTSNDTIYMLVDLYPYGVALNGSGNTAPSTETGFDKSGRLLLSDANDNQYYYLENGSIYTTTGVKKDGFTVDAYFNIKGNDVDSNLFFKDSPFKVARTGFLYLTKSTDKGKSWSAPTLLNVKSSSEQVCLVGPGRGLVTENGMIVFPCYSYNGSQESQKTSFIYSNDGGETWNRSSSYTGASWSSEAAVVELEDGTLRFFYRNGTSKLCYTDYNVKSNAWAADENTGLATNSNCQISAITYSETVDGKQVILVSCPTGPNGTGSNDSAAKYRQNGKIFVGLVNEDKTIDWQETDSINVKSKNSTNSFMYSCLTELDNGDIAILYEDNESKWGVGNDSYYQMSYATYKFPLEVDAESDSEPDSEGNLGDDEATEPNLPESTLPDTYQGTVTTDTAQGESYWQLVTDGANGIESGKKYLIASRNSGNVSLLTSAGGTSSQVSVENSIIKKAPTDCQFTLDGSGNSWTIKDANGTYLYPDYNNSQRTFATGQTEEETVTITGTSSITVLRQVDTNNCYIRYSNSRYSVYRNPSNLYLFEEVSIPGGTNYSVDLDGINSLIASVPTEQGFYTDETWSAFQEALTAANSAVSATANPYATEAEAKTQLDVVNNAALGLYDAWKSLEEYAQVDVNVIYQANGVTVKTETISVLETATSIQLEETIYAVDKTYAVDNTTLTLESGKTSYVVTVTELEGTPIEIKENETAELKVNLKDGQYVEWSTADSSYVGVAGKYDPNNNAYTNTGVIIGHNTTDEPVIVTGTIYNEDGTIAGTQNWLVTVKEGVAGTNTSKKHVYVNVKAIENCTVYYAINGGELIKINGTGVLIDDDVVGLYNIMFFAAPNEGYALTRMAVSGSANQYYPLSNGNPDGTGSGAWPFDSATQSTIPSKSDDSAWVSGHGFRWALLEENMSIEQMKIMFSKAIALGCDGATTFTKNGTEGISTEIEFVAQPLPTIEKKIISVKRDGQNNAETYNPGMKISIGDTINYQIKIKETSADIIYENVSLKDTLTGDTWTPALGSTPFEKTYTTSITLTKDNFRQVVSEGKIVNTVDLKYSYSTDYSNGSLISSASAAAEITVDVPAYVIDFGLPVTLDLSDLVMAYGNIEAASATYGSVRVNGSNIIYTPSTILKGTEHIELELENGQHAVAVHPATTVYYEEGFARGSKGDWKSFSISTILKQLAEKVGEKVNLYGFDGAYTGVGPSGGTQAVSNEASVASVTFTGTGIDIYTNNTPDSGVLMAWLKNSAGNTVKVIQVDTHMANGNKTITSGQNVDAYNVPVVSLHDLERGTYTVELRHIGQNVTNENGVTSVGFKPVALDGYRVYGTIPYDNSAYISDEEAEPIFVEMRNEILTAVSAKGTDSSYKTGGEIIEQVYKESGNLQGALVLSNSEEIDAKDLLDNGPKNELYLRAGDVVTFDLGSTTAQIGMKAVNGDAKYVLNNQSNEKTINTSTDMFYEEDVTGAVTIKNTGTNILSITQLKIFGVAAPAEEFTFEPISEEQITFALRSMAGLPAEAPGTPDTPVDPQPGTPTPEPDPEPGVPTPEPGEPSHKCTMKEEIKPATTKKDGKIVVKCTECGEVESTKVIYKASNVKLSKNEFVYNGKVKSPKLTIKDSKGNTIAKKYYSVSKPAGRKDVGKYTYTIKFKGLYEGTKKLTLTVKPKATSVKKVTASKKAFTVKWNKVSKQATGYEIMYATNSKFSKGKHTVKVTKLSTTSKKISKLKAKQKYYVKVRTYKTVKVNGKKTNIYSAWSSPKTITVKK